MSLTFTGERFLPECAGEMVYEHWHRYLLAREHVRGLRVLDVASGEGYGSHLLAQSAASVVGVDVSAEAVAHAQEKYAAPNLRYVAASCTKVPEADASFDMIVSFETIEHITEHEAFLREIDRLLKPDGVLLISSPNRPEYSERTGYDNPYHVKELDRAELRSLLDERFPAQRWFAQRAAFHSMVWPLDGAPTDAKVLATQGNDQSAYPAELYYLVFAARSEDRLGSVRRQLSLMADHDQSVYAEWSRTYRENAMLTEKIRAIEARASEATTSAPGAAASAPAPASVPTPAAGAAHEHWLVRLARKLSGTQ